MPMRLRGHDLRRLPARLREPSEQGDRLRNRFASVAAASLVLAGLLVALGEARFLLALLLSALIVAVVVVAALVLREHGAWQSLQTEVDRIRRARTPRRPSAEAPTPRVRAPLRHVSHALRATQRWIGRAAVDAGLPAAVAAEHEALADRLARSRSALGVELRRNGEPAQAIELQRTARALFAAAGNRRGEALATNSLALALADAGDERSALEEFERARALLRALGDEEHEAKVLANIGVVKQRAGAVEEAATLLEAALTKLPRDTPAYRLLERQLRRAS